MRTDAQTAIAAIVGGACSNIVTLAPHLHISTFSEEELRALEDDLHQAIRKSAAVARQIKHEQQLRAWRNAQDDE